MTPKQTVFSNCFKVVRYVLIAALPVLLQCDGCSCSGMVETEEYWGDVAFLGDEVHYAIVKHYKKYTTGTSPTDYNGETLEEKEYVYIKNARTGEEKLIFESNEFMFQFFPALFDTAICFSVGNNNEKGYVYKYTGELITTYRGVGSIAGWSVPYSKYITRLNNMQLVEMDWAADTFVVIDSSNYCNAQPWGILNKWRGPFIIVDKVKSTYPMRTQNDVWINRQQIIGTTATDGSIKNYVLRYDRFTETIDTLYDLEHSNVWVAVNSNATILIKNKTEIIDLTTDGYKK